MPHRTKRASGRVVGRGRRAAVRGKHNPRSMKSNPYSSKESERVMYHLGYTRGGRDKANTFGPPLDTDRIREAGNWHIDNQLSAHYTGYERARPILVAAFERGYYDGVTGRAAKMKRVNPAYTLLHPATPYDLGYNRGIVDQQSGRRERTMTDMTFLRHDLERRYPSMGLRADDERRMYGGYEAGWRAAVDNSDKRMLEWEVGRSRGMNPAGSLPGWSGASSVYHKLYGFLRWYGAKTYTPGRGNRPTTDHQEMIEELNRGDENELKSRLHWIRTFYPAYPLDSSMANPAGEDYDFDAEPTEPEEGDWVTEDYATFHEQGGRGVVHVPEGRDWQAVLRLHMKREQYWPSVWQLSDHGNYEVLSLRKGNPSGDPYHPGSGRQWVQEFRPRFIRDGQMAELANLWHLSRTHSNSRYERMQYTAKWFAKEHPELTSTAVYKDLDAWLAFNRMENPAASPEQYGNPMKSLYDFYIFPGYAPSSALPKVLDYASAKRVARKFLQEHADAEYVVAESLGRKVFRVYPDGRLEVMENPAASPEQYRLAQAVLGGTARGHMPESVAREIVERTPAGLRSEYGRRSNPSAWQHAGVFSEREQAERAQQYLKERGIDSEVEGWKNYGGRTEHVYGVMVSPKDYATAQPLVGHIWAQYAGIRYDPVMEPDREGNPDSDLPKCYELGYGLGASDKEAGTIRPSYSYESEAKRRIHSAGLRPPMLFDGIQSWVRGYEDGLREPVGSFPLQSNPDYRSLTDAFNAGKTFRTSGAYYETGVANARVAKYGFNKWLDNQPKSVVKAKTRLMKEFMEGWAAGRRVEAREGNPGSHGSPYVVQEWSDPTNQWHSRGSSFAKAQSALKDAKDVSADNSSGRPIHTRVMHYSTGRVYGEFYNGARSLLSPSWRERKGNPADGAATLYEEFHGVPSESETVVTEEIQYHGNLAELGTLVEIKVETLSGYKAVLGFESDPPLLCSSEDGKQLYIRGGDQSLDLDALHMSGDEWVRDSMVIGPITEFAYRTRKGSDGLKKLEYFHKAGEETGVRPDLIYDVLNNQLQVAGGQYAVQSVGVTN